MGNEATSVNGAWWEHGPIFSATHTSDRITALRPGGQPGKFSWSIVLRMVLTAVVWGIGAYLVLPRMFRGQFSPDADAMAGQWWYWPAVILLLVAGLSLGAGFGLSTKSEQTFGSQTPTLVLIGLPIAVGFAVASYVHLGHLSEYRASHAGAADGSLAPTGEILLLVPVGFSTLAVIAGLIALPLTLWGARRRQREIARVRRVGTSYPGSIVSQRFRDNRVGFLSAFDVTVAYETPAGSQQVQAHMITDPKRVPLLGSPVLVTVAAGKPLVGGKASGRGLIIEPDPQRLIMFDPDSDQYYVRSDGGGS